MKSETYATKKVNLKKHTVLFIAFNCPEQASLQRKKIDQLSLTVGGVPGKSGSNYQQIQISGGVMKKRYKIDYGDIAQLCILKLLYIFKSELNGM